MESVEPEPPPNALEQVFSLDVGVRRGVISDRVGLRKPDPEIFLLAAERLALPASACVFVDDVARYLPPAQRLGIGTIHATDPATTIAELTQVFPSATA